MPRGSGVDFNKQQKLSQKAVQSIRKCLDENRRIDYGGPFPAHSTLDSVGVNASEKIVGIYLSRHFSYQPFRLEGVREINQIIRHYLGRSFRDYRVQVFSTGQPIEMLIPNYYQEPGQHPDESRVRQRVHPLQAPLVTCLDRPASQAVNGMAGQNIVIAYSHGWYYSFSKQRWEWQRPRLFSHVEDLWPFSFAVPYLIPMLENAGATVFTTRERDWQRNEVIVDNDSAATSSAFVAKGWNISKTPAYGPGPEVYADSINPFQQGYAVTHASADSETATAQWTPNIPEPGRYAVYVSYVA
ncbi:hypothetical protein KAH55_09630, partial [bacterium]|nr:hypothetical protein [bacterium]